MTSAPNQSKDAALLNAKSSKIDPIYIDPSLSLMLGVILRVLGYSLRLKDCLNTNKSYWKDIQQYAQTS
jgi:hypothetical protein